MRIFSDIINNKTIALNESQETQVLSIDEFENYLEVLGSKMKLSKSFNDIVTYCKQYNDLLDQGTFKCAIEGKNASKTVPSEVINDISKLYKKIGDEKGVLPQLLSERQRQFVIDNRIDPNDLKLDLETPQGRNAVAKKYMRLIEKLVSQYNGKCALSKEELRSAGMIGLTNAMNEYKNPEELEKLGKEGNMSFTKYAAYRIKQQILSDITNYSRNVKISNYYQDQLKSAGEDTSREFSLDNLFGNSEDGEPMDIDRFLGIGEEDDYISQKEKERAFNMLYNRIESKFSQRDCIVFYKVWGINGYKQERAKELSKELGITPAGVSKLCTRILKFISSDPQCQKLKGMFESLAEMYIANKLFENYTQPKEVIIENLLFDDTYIFIESITKWNDKNKFVKCVNKATDSLNIDDALYIYKILANQLIISEKEFSRHKNAIISFLNAMNPQENYSSKGSDALKEALLELQSVSQKFQIVW